MEITTAAAVKKYMKKTLKNSTGHNKVMMNNQMLLRRCLRVT